MFLSCLIYSNCQTRQRKQKSKAIIEDSDDNMEQVVIDPSWALDSGVYARS